MPAGWYGRVRGRQTAKAASRAVRASRAEPPDEAAVVPARALDEATMRQVAALVSVLLELPVSQRAEAVALLAELLDTPPVPRRGFLVPRLVDGSTGE
jgi:hypothetical protein